MHDQGRKTVSAGGAVESKKIHISMFFFGGPPCREELFPHHLPPFHAGPRACWHYDAFVDCDEVTDGSNRPWWDEGGVSP